MNISDLIKELEEQLKSCEFEEKLKFLTRDEHGRINFDEGVRIGSGIDVLTHVEKSLILNAPHDIATLIQEIKRLQYENERLYDGRDHYKRECQRLETKIQENWVKLTCDKLARRLEEALKLIDYVWKMAQQQKTDGVSENVNLKLIEGFLKEKQPTKEEHNA